MAVAAERLACAIPLQPEDLRTRQKAAEFIGAVAAGSWRNDITEVETAEALTVKPIESLHEAIQLAAAGNETGRQMVGINVKTDVIERTIKSGHVTKTKLMADAAGRMQQHGQSLKSVQANSLRYAAATPQMRPRVVAETYNMFRIEYYFEANMLDDNYLVVWSRAADNMSKTNMQNAGFFTDTMSCAIQVTSAEDKQMVTESAFVAGVRYPGAERHDHQAITAVLAQFGVDVSAMNATELLGTPLLIPKRFMPGGVIDLVQLYDLYAGNTFFGDDKPAQDYETYRQTCQAREQTYAVRIEAIVDELIAEAPTITTPMMACQRLDKLSAKHMIEMAVTDQQINPDVFGDESSGRIEVARWHQLRGNYEQAQAATDEAVKADKSGSCPSGRSSDSETGSEDSGGEDADCEFTSKECPECGAKNVKTTITKLGPNKKRISGDCGCSLTVQVTV